jgi:hypothetical protein
MKIAEGDNVSILSVLEKPAAASLWRLVCISMQGTVVIRPAGLDLIDKNREG